MAIGLEDITVESGVELIEIGKTDADVLTPESAGTSVTGGRLDVKLTAAMLNEEDAAVGLRVKELHDSEQVDEDVTSSPVVVEVGKTPVVCEVSSPEISDNRFSIIKTEISQIQNTK